MCTGFTISCTGARRWLVGGPTLVVQRRLGPGSSVARRCPDPGGAAAAGTRAWAGSQSGDRRSGRPSCDRLGGQSCEGPDTPHTMPPVMLSSAEYLVQYLVSYLRSAQWHFAAAHNLCRFVVFIWVLIFILPGRA